MTWTLRMEPDTDWVTFVVFCVISPLISLLVLFVAAAVLVSVPIKILAGQYP